MSDRDYLGSKRADGVYQTVIAAMPPHDTYIESHFGTGAIMRKKPIAQRNIAIEIDRQTLSDFPPPDFAEIVNDNAAAYLREFNFQDNGRTLIYCDPPYVNETRTSNHRYRFDYTDADHLELIQFLKEVPAMVILSGYPSQLYDAELSDWRKIEFQAMTRGGPRTECLWMNFENDKVQWATFAGANFTKRQNIKRKAERWAKRYKAMPHGERLAILAALMEVENQSGSNRADSAE